MSGSQVALQWDPSGDSNITKYRVYRGEAQGVYNSVLEVAAPATALTVSNLLAGKTYFFAVTSVNSSGLESDPSNALEVMAPGLIAIPLNMETLEDQSVPIALSSALKSVSYRVETLPLNGRISGTPPNLTYTPNLNFFGSDQFTYSVSDGINRSPAATVKIAIQPRNDLPTMDYPLDQTLVQDSWPRILTLSGIGSGAANEIQPLQVSVVSANPSLIPTPTVSYVSPSAMGALILAPVPGKTGTCVLRVAVDDGQPTNNLIYRYFTVTVKPRPPVIRGLVEYSSDARTLTLGWNTDQAAACSVQYGTNINLGSVSSTTQMGTNHLVTLGNLLPGTLYCIRVNAQNGNGSSQSEIWTVATDAAFALIKPAEWLPLTAPMAISSSTLAENGRYISSATAGSGTAEFSFDAPAPGNYRIWARVKAPSAGGSVSVALDGASEMTALFPAMAGFQWMLLGPLNATSTNCLVFPMERGTRRALIRAGAVGTMVDEVAITNDPQWQPILPTTQPWLAVSNTSSTSANLNWNLKSGNATYVTIETSRDGISFSKFTTVSAASVSLPVLNLDPKATYYFRIYAYNSVDKTAYSNIATRGPIL